MEYIRGIKLIIEVDTNKRTMRREYEELESMEQAKFLLEEFDKDLHRL